MAEKRTVCEGCGTRKEKWDEDRFAYVGWIERCPGCELIEQEKETVRDNEISGAKVMVVPRQWAEYQMEQGEYGS